MKFNYLITAILIFIHGVAVSQTKLSNQKGYISYTTKEYNSKFKKTAKLFFNNTTSLYVFNKVGLDSLQIDQSIKIKSGKIQVHSSGITQEGDKIFRDFKNKQILLQAHLPLVNKCIVKDNWVSIDWKIINSYKTILGYKVQKAIGEFRGRKYIVWFSKELPFPYGPQKLFGLPGIILEAHNAEKNNTNFYDFYYRVKDICFPCKFDQLTIQKPNDQSAFSIKGFVFLKDHASELIAIKFNRATKSKMPESFVTNDSKSTPKRIKKRRQKSREVIFEWEAYPGDTENPFGQKFERLLKQVNDLSPPNKTDSNSLSKKHENMIDR